MLAPGPRTPRLAQAAPSGLRYPRCACRGPRGGAVRTRRVTLLVVCLVATAFMAGLSWFVGAVHYPLFPGVGADGWGAYHRAHSLRTTFVVLPPMLTELVTAGWLAIEPPDGVDRGALVAGFVLAAATWALTVLASQQHGRIGDPLDAAVHRRLLLVHHARTALWSAHALLLAILVA